MSIIQYFNITWYLIVKNYIEEFCDDPNFIRLVEAIQKDDEPTIRKILSEESLRCPLNVDGIRNDFIFIKDYISDMLHLLHFSVKSYFTSTWMSSRMNAIVP